MTNTLKLISAAALFAATATASLAQDVPLNTTVAGGEGAEQLKGQAGGALGLSSAIGVAAGLTLLVVVAGSDDSSD